MSGAPRERDKPWVIRTYAGHSSAAESNELYRKNLAKGQTGLSVAFDLPTQTGYDPDAELSRGEVGKVGVSIAPKGDMHTLLDGIPLDEMNTSMTINATAAWLLALYMTVAEENGIDRGVLQGTTQNDIIKEFLSRGTYAFPPEPSMRLISDTIAYTVDEVPKWNPVNICSYHLQEAGATPVQEIAYALSTAQAVLEALGVTLGRNARARAIQLPAWNEALGLPRPWDQQWSLRIQQILAYETDLLEYPDIFEGSKVMDGLVAELVEGARQEMAVVAGDGDAVE